jgi:membrane fusion protein (multidrug efflux system)
MDEYGHPEPELADNASRVGPHDEAADEKQAPAKRPSPILIVVVLLVVIALVTAGVLYWLDARHYESTDDAFIDGHISQVSSQISGRVIRLLVRDNQPVQAGQILLEIDPRDAQMKLDQALAERAQSAAQLEQARANLPVRQADAAQAQAQTRVSEADLFQAQRDLSRYHAVNPQAITRQILDNATASSRSAEAKLEAAREAASSMRAQVAAAQAQVDAAAASVKVEDAEVANARLQLSYTHVVAPASGRVTKRTVEVGLYVQPGQSLLAIVQPDLWVTANFKEAQLTDMHPGQKVRIRLDAFPDQTFEGHIDSLQAGTGSVFSSLPAENATGNYVKVVQRLPAKILFDGDDWRRFPMAPGMSVTPRVTVR